MNKLLLGALCAAFMTTSAQAATLVIDLEDVFSYAGEGSPDNVVWNFNLGANSHITGIAYDVTLTAFSPSWLSELVVSFTSTGLDGVYLTPGFANSSSGTASFAASASLVDIGLDFSLDADGLLWLEFFESFNDASVNPDGVWNGTLTVTYTPENAGPAVPEPASWALMLSGFGLVGFAARRRRLATN
ncbi:PEPxxWA-CTERM sorting domain-containing protein [Sandaracinobacter sp. RS1-74]|uniref:PEPxxWA-CTERM sorting domain-containing protein n=1 Tax=Sandaracinobacteroides sayramensis TaxID=2913411 RepID=UPI001EDC4E15|nr:PEPxxWA-CTERM sorting domain-containing protein [Sandaracinobacteroides sayramensis]MCG2841736.1 PEPxxWA-CTERM sorting domain-containing protein [Sandaracinobacteroides sayramensis]